MAVRRFSSALFYIQFDACVVKFENELETIADVHTGGPKLHFRAKADFTPSNLEDIRALRNGTFR